MDDKTPKSAEYEKIRHLLEDHETRDDKRFEEIKDKLDNLSEMVKPIYDVYTGSRFTFTSITTVLKFLALVGAAVTAFIYLKKL